MDLQRAGHADLVETPGGETYMVYLCGRPLRNRGRCTLGRETAIQKMVWGKDDWLRTLDGEGIPTIETPAPALPVSRPRPARRWKADSPVGQEGLVEAKEPGILGERVPSSSLDRITAEYLEEQLKDRENFHCHYDFDRPQLPLDFQWLRTPWPEELFSLTERPGFLRLHGRETIGSLFRQALVARRQQSHCFSAATVIEFEPEHFQQMAGLVCYYNGTKLHYLYISRDEEVGKHLRAMSCVPDSTQTDAFTPPIAIPAGKPVHVRVEVDYERLHFAYRVEGADSDWCWLAQQFDASILSDEATAPGLPNFTGAFVGMACQDMAGTLIAADFDFFEYRERSYCENPFSAH